ncbi:MAG TPA: hypothetical protein VGH82_14475 [Gaiellaceae bacterium]|jgi:hypothetical protein
MPVAFIQEFAIQGGDTSTTNYDAVAAEVGTDRPDGLLIHTAGFDTDSGVFRIFDVWETREQGDRFISDRLGPIVDRMMEAAQAAGDTSFTPPDREAWYELHDVIG